MDLKYLNAINILAAGGIGILQKVAQKFRGNFEQAWHSPRLKSFLPADAPRLSQINPEKEWGKLQKASAPN